MLRKEKIIENRYDMYTYTVTLKMRRRRRARRTERPNEPAFGLKWVQTTSKTLPLITRQSNLKAMRLYIKL